MDGSIETKSVMPNIIIGRVEAFFKAIHHHLWNNKNLILKRNGWRQKNKNILVFIGFQNPWELADGTQTTQVSPTDSHVPNNKAAVLYYQVRNFKGNSVKKLIFVCLFHLKNCEINLSIQKICWLPQLIIFYLEKSTDFTKFH